jgi:hypothetical protein
LISIGRPGRSPRWGPIYVKTVFAVDFCALKGTEFGEFTLGRVDTPHALIGTPDGTRKHMYIHVPGIPFLSWASMDSYAVGMIPTISIQIAGNNPQGMRRYVSRANLTALSPRHRNLNRDPLHLLDGHVLHKTTGGQK